MARSNITVLGTKELNDMFMELPKQIKKNTIWLTGNNYNWFIGHQKLNLF